MIKALFISLLLSSAAAHANTIHIVSKTANLDITTRKVAHLEADVDMDSLAKFNKEMDATKDIKGPRVIVINSRGGMSFAAALMIARLEAERAAGVMIVCMVKEYANSMAFDLLTRCDARLAAPDAQFVFHKIAYTALLGNPDLGFKRLTPNELRRKAAEIEAEDEPYRQANAKALKMSLRDYDRYADQDSRWTAKNLFGRGYLHGILTPVAAPQK